MYSSWNVIFLGLGFFCVFAAYNTAQFLSTSIPAPHGLAEVSLGVLYAVFSFTSILTPPLVEKMSIKTSLIIGSAMYVGMILVPLHLTWSLGITMYTLVGIGAPILWTASALYIGRCSVREASLTGNTVESCTSYFNGVFFGIFQAAGTFGLLVGGIVLNTGDNSAIHSLFIVLAILCLCGVLLLSFVPNVKSIKETIQSPMESSLCDEENSYTNDLIVSDERESLTMDGSNTLNNSVVHSSTFKDVLQLLFTDSRMFLFVPILVYNGMSLGYFFGSFTVNLITPTLGLSYTCYIGSIGFYFVNSISSYTFGKISGIVGRRKIIILAIILHSIFFTCLFLWWPLKRSFKMVEDHGVHKWVKIGNQSPHWQQYSQVWFLAILFALADAVWETFPYAILQTFFASDERRMNAANANLKMFQSLGLALQFFLGLWLKHQQQVNVSIIATMLLIGIISLAVLDVFVQSVA